MTDVVCPKCRAVCYETTEHYDHSKATNGRMLRLKKPYRQNQWGELDPSATFGALLCASCGDSIAHPLTGKVFIKLPPRIFDWLLDIVPGEYTPPPVVVETRTWQCQDCKFKAKTESGLKSHMRHKHS